MEYHLFVKKIPDGVSPGLYGYKGKVKGVWEKIQMADEHTGFSDELIDSINPAKNLRKIQGIFSKSVQEEGNQPKEKSGLFDGVSKAFSKNSFEKLEDATSDDYGVKISAQSLQGLYEIPRNELRFGLLDSKVLKSIFQSYPDAILTIRSVDAIPDYLKHYSGSSGKFNEGFWISHPKHKNTLLPLRGFIDLVGKLILEETVRAYEALGAKRIEIEDITILSQKSKSKLRGISLGSNYSKEQYVLREKEYGPGVFDPERAKKDKLFIWDIPAVVSTIEARIKGNQTLEKFTEKVNLKIGVEIQALKAFNSISSNLDYEREWRFLVEFYPKEQIPTAIQS